MLLNKNHTYQIKTYNALYQRAKVIQSDPKRAYITYNASALDRHDKIKLLGIKRDCIKMEDIVSAREIN